MKNNSKFHGYRKMEVREHQLLQLEAMKHIHSICEANHIQYYLIAGSILGAVRHGGFIPWDDDIDIALMRDEYERFKVIFTEQCDNSKYFLQHYDSDPEFRPALMRVCIKNTILDIPETMSHHFCHNTYLDVFPLDNVPDEETKREDNEIEIQKYRKRINRSYYYYNPNNRGLRYVRELVKIVLVWSNKLIYSPRKQREKLLAAMKRYDNVTTKCVCSMASGYSYKKQTMPRFYYGIPKLINFEDTLFYGPSETELYLKHLYGDDYMTPRNKFKNGHAHDVYIKV